MLSDKVILVLFREYKSFNQNSSIIPKKILLKSNTNYFLLLFSIYITKHTDFFVYILSNKSFLSKINEILFSLYKVNKNNYAIYS
jgi:hypothetical protein